MVFSSPDMLGLIAEIFTRRAAMVCGKAANKQGMTLNQYLDCAPKYTQNGLKMVEMLHKRYLTGDYRHSENELLAIEVFCNWLVEIHHQDQPEPWSAVMFDVGKLQSKQCCKPKLYIEAMAKVQAVW